MRGMQAYMKVRWEEVSERESEYGDTSAGKDECMRDAYGTWCHSSMKLMS